MKLNQRIPKHIYDRGASGLGEPDFYAGPTISEKESPNRSWRASRQDDDLKADMKKIKEETARDDAHHLSPLFRFVALFRG
jgi:hypothetical protein